MELRLCAFYSSDVIRQGGLESDFGISPLDRSGNPPAPDYGIAWQKLAYHLIKDLIPAFPSPEKRGRKKAAFNEPTQQGHTLLTGPRGIGAEEYDKAQFVFAVRAARVDTLSSAFLQLATNRKKRTLLPARYKSLRTKDAIHKTYYGIERKIRDHPERFTLDPAGGAPRPVPAFIYGIKSSSLLGGALKPK